MHHNSAREPSPLSEMAAMRLMRERAEHDGTYLNFIGAGAYEHHIPAVVSQLAARGDFCANISAQSAADVQGTLQLLHQFQSRMAMLLALDAVSCGAADGACALADAITMALRLHDQGRRVLMPRTLHPLWRGVVRTLTRHQRIEWVDLPYDPASGQSVCDGVDAAGCAVLIVPQPNFFGALEAVDELTDWAHARGVLVIGVVNPLAMALLKPPGEWGGRGADIAVGEVQPLGMPLSDRAGFVACRAEFAAELPGCRVVHDGHNGHDGAAKYRAQSKHGTSPTPPVAGAACMAIMGGHGLAAVAQASADCAAALASALAGINGIERAFSAPIFHEFVLKLATPAAAVLHALKAQGILGGIPLIQHFPGLGESLLVCATETKTATDIARYADNMTRIIGKRFQPAPCSIKQARNY